MCASYGALESTLVSTRSTVPFTLARAAARTLAATSPVSGFSVLPLTVWAPCGRPCGRAWLPAAGDAAGETDGADGDVLDVAALAIAAPLTAAAPTAAAVTSLVRTLPIDTPWVDDGTPIRVRGRTVSAARTS